MLAMRLWVFLCLAAASLGAAGAPAQTPLINEFMAANSLTIADEDGDHPDWIELYNPGTVAFDLTDCYLSDSADDPLRWRFPAGTIPPQGYLLIWASGKDRIGPQGQLHTSFAINVLGEPLLLTAADASTRLDEVGPIALVDDVSYGRLPDGSGDWQLFAEPTPQAANSSGVQYLPPPVFSLEPGFYAAAVQVAIAAEDPAAVITYTLDGSEPTADSPVYEGPLTLASRVGDPNVYCLIPTTVAYSPPRGEVFKINVVRARAFLTGHAPSPVATGSYIVDPALTSRYSVSVVSLATAAANLFDDEIGIYVPGNAPGYNYNQIGLEWERPVHVELFDVDGARLLAQDAGARIHGGVTRNLAQKTLRLYARSLYGPAHFDAPLFAAQPDDSYDRFLIRNSGNDFARLGFKDLAIQTIAAGMGFDTQAGRPVVHFINGEYWGLGNIRERYDDHYLRRRYQVSEDEAVILSNNAVLEVGLPADQIDYTALRAFVINNDMTQPANLAHAAERMDLENFIAYNVAQIICANQDWPHNNIRYWRRRTAQYEPLAPAGQDGRWRWLLYDTDLAYGLASHRTLDYATTAGDPDWPHHPWYSALLRGLLVNEGFRHDFINALADHLNTTFQPDRAIGIIDSLSVFYEPEIAEWQDRWDADFDWHVGVQALRDFAVRRPDIMRQHVCDKFALPGLAEVTLSVNDPAQGRLQINGLVIDTDLPGLADPARPYPWTGRYFQGIPLTVTALPASGHRLVAWQHDGSQDPTLTLVPGHLPIALAAVFSPDVSPSMVLHAWHFNDLPDVPLTTIPADVSLLGYSVITYPGTGAGFMDRVEDGTTLGALPETPAGYALRVRNPSDTRELRVSLPSTGHEDLALAYAVRRTESGAQVHSVQCRVAAGGDWHAVAEDVVVAEAYQVFEHVLSAVPGADDNPELQVRFVFGGSNASGTSGNQRLDNLTLRGRVLPGVNLPPLVAAGVEGQRIVEAGAPLVLDVSGVFADPEDDTLAHFASSDDPDVAAVVASGSSLTITPLQRGAATITLRATDGYNAPAATSFEVQVHPQAVALADGDFSFVHWDAPPATPAYPPHMLLLCGDEDELGFEKRRVPAQTVAIEGGRDVPGPAADARDGACSTWIDALGEDGISFVDQGRGRGQGAALLALDTRRMKSVELGWLGGTVRPNTCTYALRLQYRLGLDGPFDDLLVDDQPFAYISNKTPGHAEVFAPIVLPPDLLDREYLQLLWRYHHLEDIPGDGAELRLDDITIQGQLDPTGVETIPPPPTTALHGNAPNPFNPATEIRFSIREGERGRLVIYNGRGQRVRDLGVFASGRHRARWDGTCDRGRRCSSGVYFYRLSTATGDRAGKMTLIK